MVKNKTILVVANDGFVERAFLHSDFLLFLKKEFQKIIILTSEEKLAMYRQRYQGDAVVIEVMPNIKTVTTARKVFFEFVRCSIPSSTGFIVLVRSLLRVETPLRFAFHWLMSPLLFISWHLAKYKFWRSFLRKGFSLFKVNSRIVSLLEKHKPDLVFARYDPTGPVNFVQELFKAAKYLGIKSCANIFSWDNLYSKVFVLIHADFLTVGNPLVKKEAMRIADFRGEVIKITGLPQFDIYFKKESILPREQFFRAIGADHDKKLIIFATGTNRFYNTVDNSHFLKYFSQLSQNQLPAVQFYARSHPKAPFRRELVEQFQGAPNIIIEQEKTRQKGSVFEFKASDRQFLLNLLYHSELIVTFYSTILIESFLVNKPVVVINYSGSGDKGYYSIKRFRKYEHVRQIINNNCFRLANNDLELLEIMKNYLVNPILDKQGRDKTIKEQVYFFDGLSADRMVRFLSKIVYE